MSLGAKPTSAACLGASEVISKKVRLENIILAQKGNLHFADAVHGWLPSRDTRSGDDKTERWNLIINMY